MSKPNELLTEEMLDNALDANDSMRKKRKDFAIIATGPSVTGELQRGITDYIKKKFPQLTITVPRNHTDLLRLMSRQVSILILDDEFYERKDLLAIVRLFKERKPGGYVPVIFLTQDAHALVKEYQDQLFVYQESDDYIEHRKDSFTHAYSAIKGALTDSARRRSRRYKIDLPVMYSALDSELRLRANIIDLSVHGAQISVQEGIFKQQEQIMIYLPVKSYIDSVFGEYISIAAKVRRVQISGTVAGVSFEHLTEEKYSRLTQFLINYVTMNSLKVPTNKKI